MSTVRPPGAETRNETETASPLERLRSASGFRILSLAGVSILIGTYVWILYGIVGETGATGLLAGGSLLDGSDQFLLVVVGLVAAATVLGKTIDGRVAALITAALALLGTIFYLLVVPEGFSLVFERSGEVLADILALLTGLPVSAIARADAWALGFVPAPVFISWYLAMRRRYLAATAVSGLALFLLVLTSDATVGITVVGMLAGIAAVGFGELDRREGTLLQADVLIVLVALITVTSLTLSVVPAGAAEPLRLGSLGGGGAGTVEGTIVGSPRELGISGSIDLSPKVRFTVEAGQERYWRTGVYDKFAGGQWFRLGQSSPYDGDLDSPPGPRETVVQTYTVESQVKTMPAAAEPVAVVGEATENTMVTAKGTLKPKNKFIEGDRYRIRSAVLNATPAQLRNASTEYPSGLDVKAYTQLPESTSSRFRQRTAEITADAENPYETAKAIERYLEENKEYSLEVDKPSGNVANNFLLEMDAGYCTYFATTMTAMLRTQGVPARIAVGYTPGQQIAENEWVVRGLNSHVWVEVYFPEYGWVTFDPTPAGPRTDAEIDRVQEAREEGNGSNVDTNDSADEPLTPTATETSTPTGSPTLPPNQTAVLPPNAGGPTLPPDLTRGGAGDPGPIGPTATNGTSGGSGGTGGLPSLPSGQDALIGVVLLLGAAAGAHRVGIPDRAYRAARLRWQGSTDDPVTDVERAYDRLETLLARQYRERRPGETPRAYMTFLAGKDVDERASRVADAYERAHYAGEADRETADEAIALVDAMVRERTPVLGWMRRVAR